MRSRRTKRPTSDVRVERNIYQWLNRDGALERFGRSARVGSVVRSTRWRQRRSTATARPPATRCTRGRPGPEPRHHVRSAKTIRSRSRRRTATGERLGMPTFGEPLALIDGMPELQRLWFLFLGLTAMRPSEAADMCREQSLIDTSNGWICTPALPMVEQNVGYWACGDARVTDPEWETKLDQLVDEVLGPLEEFRPLDGVPWLFPGRRTPKTLNTVFGSVPLSYDTAQVKLRQQVAGTPLEGLQQYELRHSFASVSRPAPGSPRRPTTSATPRAKCDARARIWSVNGPTRSAARPGASGW